MTSDCRVAFAALVCAAAALPSVTTRNRTRHLSVVVGVLDFILCQLFYADEVGRPGLPPGPGQSIANRGHARSVQRPMRSGRENTMRHLGRYLYYSLRTLIRTPALTATIVLTVGLGLGATTGMLSVVRAVLISPLPYAAPESLFWIYTDTP